MQCSDAYDYQEKPVVKLLFVVAVTVLSSVAVADAIKVVALWFTQYISVYYFYFCSS